MPSHQKGFSLAEILVMIAVIIIIFSIGYANFKSYQQNQELKNSTKEVVSHLKLAQQYSVTEQVKYALRVQLLERSSDLIRRTALDEIVDSFLLADNVYFSSSVGLPNNEAVFNPTGAVDFSGELFLNHSQTNEQTKIIIKPSGYVSWENL